MRTPDSHSEFDSDFEKDPLWNVLGKAVPVDASQISPFFVRNVVRTARLSESKEERFPMRWRVPTLAFAALIVTGLFCTALQQGPTHSSALGLNPTDAEVVRHLDELLTYEETNLWLEPPVL